MFMCDHVSKVLAWSVDDQANFTVALWGCTDCDWKSDSPWIVEDEDVHEHVEYVEGCFACKIRTLELATGDAKSNMIQSGWTNKKWDNELKAYRDARAQGIQPKSTKLKDIQAAVDFSNKTGKAFQA
jgi:hypothetical protein